MAILFGDNYCQARFQAPKRIKGRHFVASIQILLKLVVVDTFIQDCTMTSDVLGPKYMYISRASNYKENLTDDGRSNPL